MATSEHPVEVLGERVAPGERRHFLLPLGYRVDGSRVGIPLMVLNGVFPGPRLGVTTGIHGDEYEGPEALRRFLARVDPRSLRGLIIATPHANPIAYESQARVGHIDYLDLNRTFPGSKDGFITERIANLLVEEIVRKVDFLVDLHSAGLAYHLEPYAGFNNIPGKLGEASFALAKAFGTRFLYASTPFPKVMRLEAAKRNVPACLVEAGGEGRINLSLVSFVERGLLNIARHIGMIDGQPVELPTDYCILKAPPTGEYINASSGGFMVSRVSLGERVVRGQLLATIEDVFGTELARLEAPFGGVVIIQRTLPVVNTGDWAFAILLEAGKASRDTPLSALIGLEKV